MSIEEVYYLLAGLLFGLFLGWLLWRFKTLSRDQAATIRSKQNSLERRLERSTNDLAESEATVADLEAQLADERKIFEHALLGDLAGKSGSKSVASTGPSTVATSPVEIPADGSVDQVQLLSERLAQSQSWLDEAYQRIEALEDEVERNRLELDRVSGRAETLEARLNQTHRALVEADSQVTALTGRLTASEKALSIASVSIKKIRRHVKSANSAVSQGLDDPLVIDLREGAEPGEAEIASLVGAKKLSDSDGSMLPLVEANGRLLELESELSHTRSELKRVAGAPERAATLEKELSDLKAKIEAQKALTQQLSDHIDQREEIDQKLDSVFVEIHELRGRSAALRSELNLGHKKA